MVPQTRADSIHPEGFRNARAVSPAERTYNGNVKLAAVTPRAMAASHIFRIMFVNQGKVYEIYARKVGHGDLFGFIEVEDVVFGERSSVVLDPAEERIKSEFEGVKRTFLPMHSVLRIDEVKKHGTSKITALEGGGANVAQFPMPLYSSPPTDKK
jgi:hypothetical protein